MLWYFKYLISSFVVILLGVQQYCLAQTTTVRPYKFGFTIEEQQHRYEKRDERGIVMGEFGFITADGIYHVTVYATDEQGRFRILAMKNYPYESPPKSVEVMVKPKVTTTTTTTTTTEKPVLTRHNFNTEACSGCFLKNGNNKPKSINGVGDKNVKTDIRPLSKSISSAPKTVAKQPGLTGMQPKLPSNKPGISVKLSNTDILLDPVLKPKTNNQEVYTTSDLIAKPTKNPTKSITLQYITKQQQHVTVHSTATLSKSIATNVAKPYSIQSIPTVNDNNNKRNLFDNTTKSVIKNTQYPLKTKTNKIVHNSPLNTDFKHDNTLDTSETIHIPTVVTKTKTYIKENTPIPTTINTNVGNSGIKQTPKGFNKQYTTPTLSKVTNPTTNTRPQGNTGSISKSNTATGNTPPIMDIIVKKILPTLMASEGKSLTTNNKPSATPSSSGSTKTLIQGGKSIPNSQSNNKKATNKPSSINGDGDLYRFKYILDYHGHTETGKRNGNKEGNYFVIGDDDVERTIEYVANENGYQPHIRWRKLDPNEIKSKENTLKDYEFVWFTQ